jgi:hypothetical protein
LLTLDTQLELVFQFSTNLLVRFPTFCWPVTARGAFSEVWSVPRSFQTHRTLQHS